MKKFNFLHPLLFAIFPILAFYTHNIEKIRFNKIITPIELSIGLTIGFWLVINGLVRNKYKTSILVTFLLLLFYSYGHFYNILEKLFLENTEEEKIIVFSLFWIFLLGLGGFLIKKLREGLHIITNFLSITGAILILVSLIQIFIFNLNNIIEAINYSSINKTNNLFKYNNQNITKKLTDSPDIYYIILDGYASNEVLKNVYGYDNRDFINFLKSKGFNIASEARSNYALTFLSLASSLNMKYVNYLIDIVGIDSADRLQSFRLIKDNEVLRILKSKGYHSIHFSSGWAGTDNNKFADINVYCGKINQITTSLVLTTVLRPFESIYLPQDTRERIICTFSQLANIREDVNGPIFVFSHIVSPHPPYVFGVNGEKTQISEMNEYGGLDNWQNKKGYLNQLVFINKKVKELIEKLTLDQDRLPIIIIQADHGSASTPGMEEYNMNLIQERMRPFVAYRLPDKDNFIPNSITPVNIFRFIFNNYFDADYEILEDKIQFSNYEKPYRFIDVTKAVSKN